jgi:hypothetical protein
LDIYSDSKTPGESEAATLTRRDFEDPSVRDWHVDDVDDSDGD